MRISGNIVTVGKYEVKRIALNAIDKQLNEDYIDTLKHNNLSAMIRHHSTDMSTVFVNVMGARLLDVSGINYTYEV